MKEKKEINKLAMFGAVIALMFFGGYMIGIDHTRNYYEGFTNCTGYRMVLDKTLTEWEYNRMCENREIGGFHEPDERTRNTKAEQRKRTTKHRLPSD